MSDKVNNIKYDKYGKRTYIEYANGTNTKYVYNRHNQQLVSLTSIGADDAILQDIHYEYDDVYNITEINNTGDYPYNYTYEYDKLNRLVKSEGSSVIGDNRPSYRFLMSYSPTGRVLDYSLEGRKYEDEEMLSLNSASHYLYEDERHPHAVTKIGDVPSLVIKYSWDANGNIKRRKAPRRPGIREHYFNEENRLAAISDKLVDDSQINFNNTVSGPVATYLYDADGERVWKFYGMATATYRNGVLVNSDLEMDKTFYPTPQTTFTKQKFYKHYFIGGERICTQVTQYVPPISAPNAVGFIHGSTSDFMLGMGNQVKHSLDSVGYSGNISIDPVFNSIGSQIAQRPQKYYYHYNHQGSVALVTWQNGTIRQHLQYLPYGGTFVDQHTSSFASPFTFSAKEKDAESGYNYFGARYYTDNIMMWLSVDPMSDERPWISPYNYCQWNPIGRVDTWGMLDAEWSIDKATGRITKLNDNIHTDANGNEVDVLFNSRGESIDVTKGTLDQKQPQPSYHSYGFTDVNEAENFYYFCAESSDVEWAFVDVMQYGKSYGFVGADNPEANPNSSGSTKMLRRYEDQYGQNIRRGSHSHPGTGGYPSIFKDYKTGNLVGDIPAARESKYNYIREVYDVPRNIIYRYDGDCDKNKPYYESRIRR